MASMTASGGTGSPEQPARSGGRGRRPSWRALGLALVVVVLVLLVYDAIQATKPRLTQRDVATAVANALASATPPPAVASLVYQAVRPSVVAIEVSGPPKEGKTEDGEGTGVVVDQSGSILTALHVVQDATQITVIFADGTHSAAKIVTQQPENDIAVIRATNPPAQLIPAVLGDPSALQVGDEAIVIGNPFGLVDSLTTGSISGLGRVYSRPDGSGKIQDLIQFDAAVNPGNSGGPLLDRRGEVVGIVTALANPTTEKVFIGIGFAVPITTASSALGSSPY